MQYVDAIHALNAAKQLLIDQGYPKYEPIAIIGSQSILLHFDEDKLPSLLTMSSEIDVIFPDHPDIDTADLINGTIGEDSQFHGTFGYYVDGVVQENIVLPTRWLDRAKRVSIPSTYDDSQIEIIAIMFEDMLASKLYAHRQKDIEYIKSCKQEGLIDEQQLFASVMDLPISLNYANALIGRYEHIGQTKG